MKYKKTKIIIALSSAIYSMSFQGTAWAQQNDKEDSKPSSLEVIVVTAQKRPENLQETPIAVTAFSSDDLQNKNINNIAQIAEFTPNLIFDETAPLSGSSSAAVLFIRGVGQSSYQVTDDPGVGTYVDGVYVGSSVGGVLDVVDVETIEVLRGPQGTLFGRNTIGGALNITTKKPNDVFGGNFEITGGNFNRLNVKGSVDIPITDNLLTKFSVSQKRADGWVELLAESNATNTENNRNQKKSGDDNESALKASILYTPSDALSINITADVSHVREASAASTLLGIGKNCNNPTFAGDSDIAPPNLCKNHGILNLIYNTQPELPNVPGYGRIPYDERWVPDNPARQSYRNGPNGTEVDTYGVASVIEWSEDENFAVKSISSFRKVDSKLNRDADGSPLTIVHCFNDFKHEQASQELQVSGNAFDSGLKWLAGVYYFKEKAVDNFRCQLPFNLFLRASVDNTSVAAFGQTSYELTDKLTLTTGIRWTRDKKSLFPEFGVVEAFDRPDTLIPNLPVVEVNDTFNDVAPKIALDYQVSDSMLLYTSYSTGFKSGGFSSRTLVARDEVLRFKPEELETFEIGTKSEFFNHQLRVNAAAFISQYDDIQGNVIEGIAPGTQNIGDSRIRGIEIEITGIATDNLFLNANVSYLHNEYTRLAPLSEGVAADGFILPTNKLTNSPEWSFSGSFEYTMPVANIGGDLIFRGDYSWYSEIYNDDLNSEALKQDSYGLLNAQVAYYAYNADWTLTFWAKNITDKEYIVSGDDNIYAGFTEANFGTPRTYGITLRTSF